MKYLLLAAVIYLVYQMTRALPAAEEIAVKPDHPDHIVMVNNMVKRFEGFRASAYKCPAGKWTIGYGRTEDVRSWHVTTPEREARWLDGEIRRIDLWISDHQQVPLSPGQRAALISFAYNVGLGALKKSTLWRLLNQGDYVGAAGQFERWVHGGGKVLPGLVARRKAERYIFDGEEARRYE